MSQFGRVEPGQAVFRGLVAAMSHPGRRIGIDVAAGPNRASVAPLLFQVAETLLDHEVSFHVVAPDGSDRFSDGIFSRTKAAKVDLETADYVFVDGGDSRGAVERARRGTLPYPDQGATLIYYQNTDGHSLTAAAGGSLSLVGPGIDGTITPELRGLSAAELNRLKQINADFPLGVDVLVLREPDQVMAIPRSTRIVVT